ncbi:MAG: hypothetical protein HOH04_02535 [Rhodospirillaceae bacterium]|jgi:hypothetical protein|nr:hypothetical protein [Rhodospirillaceae bacterium]
MIRSAVNLNSGPNKSNRGAVVDLIVTYDLFRKPEFQQGVVASVARDGGDTGKPLRC